MKTSEAPGREPALDRAHQILLDTARQLGSSLDPDAIFARMLASVRGTMRCDGMIVSSYRRDEGVICCEFAWVGGNHLDPSTLPPLQYRQDSSGMQSQVIRTGRPMIFSDVLQRVRDPDGTYYEVDPQGGVRNLKDGAPPLAQSAIMAPLRLEGEVVGVAQVMADAENAYSPWDLEMLEGIALLVAVALENARLFRRLEDELEERRRAEGVLRRTEEALRQADRRKDEFLATLGHELRNPLNPIRSAVELLRLRNTGDDETRAAHELIQRQVIHLTRLIDDLLDVSRITQGKLELRRSAVSLEEVIEAACGSMRPLLASVGQTLMVRLPDQTVALEADAVRLAQVFANLLDNASKYSPPGAEIVLVAERRDAEVSISVRDPGRGIASADLPHVFDLFYQADRSAGRHQDGLGIGLTLVKRLVDMHGGRVEASSPGPERGSHFTVILPLATRPAKAKPSPPPAEDSQTPKRILIADDNRDSADSMAMLLRLGGHEVLTAYDGEEAAVKAIEFRPDVMLLDIGMPRLNGYEVAERLRAQPWARELVLIAATGWGAEDDRRRSMETGFDAHLVKPVDPTALQRLIGSLAGRASGS